MLIVLSTDEVLWFLKQEKLHNDSVTKKPPLRNLKKGISSKLNWKQLHLHLHCVYILHFHKPRHCAMFRKFFFSQFRWIRRYLLSDLLLQARNALPCRHEHNAHSSIRDIRHGDAPHLKQRYHAHLNDCRSDGRVGRVDPTAPIMFQEFTIECKACWLSEHEHKVRNVKCCVLPVNTAFQPQSPLRMLSALVPSKKSVKFPKTAPVTAAIKYHGERRRSRARNGIALARDVNIHAACLS